MPGFTHLQTAQPVTWGHHMMAYVEMFGRDASRFPTPGADERMPPWRGGAGRHVLSHRPGDDGEALGFDRPCANSLDAVSDRDFALEFLPRRPRSAPCISAASPRNW
jgi:argininosuccinate lyase